MRLEFPLSVTHTLLFYFVCRNDGCPKRSFEHATTVLDQCPQRAQLLIKPYININISSYIKFVDSSRRLSSSPKARRRLAGSAAVVATKGGSCECPFVPCHRLHELFSTHIFIIRTFLKNKLLR